MSDQKRYAPLRRISEGAIQRLMEYYWPGNVRELENVSWDAMLPVQASNGNPNNRDCQEQDAFGAARGSTPRWLGRSRSARISSQRRRDYHHRQTAGGR